MQANTKNILKTSSVALAALFIFFSHQVRADGSPPKPTSSEARKVIDYYISGKNGPVLLKTKLCASIKKEVGGSVCLSEVESLRIKNKKQTFLWMDFFAPINSLNNISIRWSVDGREAYESHVSFEGELSHGVPFSFTPDDTGDWTATLFWEKNSLTYLLLGEFQFKVTN